MLRRGPVRNAGLPSVSPLCANICALAFFFSNGAIACAHGDAAPKRRIRGQCTPIYQNSQYRRLRITNFSQVVRGEGGEQQRARGDAGSRGLQGCASLAISDRPRRPCGRFRALWHPECASPPVSDHGRRPAGHFRALWHTEAASPAVADHARPSDGHFPALWHEVAASPGIADQNPRPRWSPPGALAHRSCQPSGF